MALLAACSDGDGDAPAASTSMLPPTTATTAAPSFTGEPDSPFCALLVDVAVDGALDGALDGDAADPAAVGDAFRSVVEVLQQTVELAPPEILADVTLVAEGMDALDEALAAVGYDFDALAASGAADDVLSAVNDPAFADAGVRLAAFREQVCGL